ncbi:uncharacterized protein LOC126373038 [Pectinophora gossypiella]|uniref:uncharacterized protein LOC126373038 n=1 Tax=Pectinophora gossypiella TaxID=13191 RepID=UPI00214F3514|nr:uncharacterized protein LOC126373038 [Pectinophora gossypiella]
MPPNTIEVAVIPDISVVDMKPQKPNLDQTQVSDDGYKLQIFQSSLNLFTHILIGATVGICLMFAFRNGVPLSATNMHIVLCVIGYQLLMAEAILSLAPENGWSAKLTLLHKRRAHWVLQIAGSALAIIGSIIKILDKNVHWNTLHGQFALVALIFTGVSLVNGLSSLYAYELRRVIPGNLSRLTHICFGTVAFAAAAISLCYGMDKGSFRNWATPSFAYTIMSFVATLTFITIISPLLTFGRKSLNFIK